MRRIIFLFALVGGCLSLQTNHLLAQEGKAAWGNLSATFLYDGEPPKPVQLKVDKDQSLFKDPVYDRSLMVNPKSKGLANVVLWLYVAEGKKPPKARGDEKLADEVLVEATKGEIVPFVSLVRTGQTLVIKNSDPVGHNISHMLERSTFGRTIPAGPEQREKIEHAQTLPAPMCCHIHPWMNAYLVVREHPFVGISNPEGKVTIKDLPAGRHTFVVWHTAGTIRKVKRDGKEQVWERGRVIIDIKAGENNLGAIFCKPVRMER